jgi:hypothetical protein
LCCRSCRSRRRCGRRTGRKAPWNEAERAAFGVAAEQGALRALEHFDALHVEQRGVEAVLAAHVDAVDVDAHALFARRLVGVERHDAANADGQRRLARFEGGDAQAGDAAVGQIEQALDVAVLDRFSRNVDRDRRLSGGWFRAWWRSPRFR